MTHRAPAHENRADPQAGRATGRTRPPRRGQPSGSTTGPAATLAAPGHGAHRERTKEAGIDLPGHLGAHGHRFESGGWRLLLGRAPPGDARRRDPSRPVPPHGQGKRRGEHHPLPARTAAGADLARVQRLAGHRSPGTTGRDGRRPEDALREAAALVHVPCLGAVH